MLIVEVPGRELERRRGEGGGRFRLFFVSLSGEGDGERAPEGVGSAIG